MQSVSRIVLAVLLVAASGARDRFLRAADEDFSQFGIFAKTSPRAAACPPGTTTLPLEIRRGDRICLIGNTLFERAQLFGQLTATLHAAFPDNELVIRNLAWSADEIDLTPRPENFADIEQHLTYFKADVIIAAYGFNESFAGAAGLPDFRTKLAAFLAGLQSKAFNGSSAPRIVLVSPIANENLPGVAAANRNNANIRMYTEAMQEVAHAQGVGFVDLFEPTLAPLADPTTTLTINGCHLTRSGYDLLAEAFFRGCFQSPPPVVEERLRIADRPRSAVFPPLPTAQHVLLHRRPQQGLRLSRLPSGAPQLRHHVRPSRSADVGHCPRPASLGDDR